MTLGLLAARTVGTLMLALILSAGLCWSQEAPWLKVDTPENEHSANNLSAGLLIPTRGIPPSPLGEEFQPLIRLSSAELGIDDEPPQRDPEDQDAVGEDFFVRDDEGPSPHDDPSDPPRSLRREIQILQQRLDEMDTARKAHEDATRQVIRKTFSEKGSNINDMVIFGGALETTAGWFDDFGTFDDADGSSESDIFLSTAELDFEIQVNPWTVGYFVIEYDDGLDNIFLTVVGDEASVDRFNVDTAYVTIGDPFMCWPYLTVGRVVAPFGISTGARLGDVLTLDGPLTTDVFEYKEDVILFGFEAPTPPPPPPPSTASIQPPPQGTVYPIVEPLILRPIFRRFSQRHCRGVYCGAAAVPPTPTPTLPPPIDPPFTGAIYFYNGDTFRGRRTVTPAPPDPAGQPDLVSFSQGEDHIEHIGGTLGYRTRGCCYALGWPWSMDIDIDFNSSAFDSRFLEFEYRPFLGEIGYVPAMATHIKSTLGPFSLIAEWNGALRHATFFDQEYNALNDTVIEGQFFAIRPEAWAVALGYQFDWNPGVQEIGAQGTYFAITYSQSTDLAGVTRIIDGEETRVGFVPRERLSVGVGEWVLDGLRVAVEYSYAVDYRRSARTRATGRNANAFFGTLTYEW